MKHFLCFLLVLLVASCGKKESSPIEQVTAYYNGFVNSDYNQIKESISDSLTIIEGDYTMVFTPESFYEQFKWDSVFKPKYNLVALEKADGHIIATASVESLRFEFLKNNPLTCKHKFYIESGKIARIENIDCTDANWEIWQTERDSLVSWIKINHPKLDGFVHDLSMKGAVNYLKAIALYQNDKAN